MKIPIDKNISFWLINGQINIRPTFNGNMTIFGQLTE